MSRFILASAAVVVAGGLLAAPVPPEPDAKTLVAGLSDPSEKVRDDSAAALRNRVDALPWLRRAARSTDKDTAKRAADLLAPSESKRQEAVAKAIDACIRDGRIDLLTEWHQYWKPKVEEDLWPVGPRAAKAGLDLFAKSCSKEAWATFERRLAETASLDTRFHNGPCPERFEVFKGAWTIRTDRMDQLTRAPYRTGFASVAGPVHLPDLEHGGHYLALGPVQTSTIATTFVACDGEIGSPRGVRTGLSVVVCRGNFRGGEIGDAVLLVDGDIELGRAGDSDLRIMNSLIRASGEIRLPKGVKPVNCTLEARAKNATAPYTFFELADVGLSVTDGKDGVAVTAVKADTPFGNCGLVAGDAIRLIDNAPVGTPADFRKAVRRALVRQGDCLVTVVRGNKTLDLPVFFPLPK